MFKLGYTKSTDNFNFNAPQNNAPLDRGIGYQPPTNLADGNTESLYPAYLPSNNIHTNLFPAFNPHGFFDDYWMTPPVDYRGLEVEDVDRSKNIVVTDPRDDEEPPGQLNTFNTKPGQRPIVDALRSFLKNQEIQTKNDPDRNMRDEIISRLKSHGLFKDRYNELSNSELRTLATNIAGVNNMDPNELIPKDINTQSSNVHSATNMVDQPEGSGQQGPGLNSGNVPSAAQANFRGAVGTNTSNTFDAARRATGSQEDLDSVEKARDISKQIRKQLEEGTEGLETEGLETGERVKEALKQREQVKAEAEGRGASATTESISADDLNIESVGSYLENPSLTSIPKGDLEARLRREIKQTKQAGFDPTIKRQSLTSFLSHGEKNSFGTEKQTPNYKIYRYLIQEKGKTPEQISKTSKKYDNKVSITKAISKYNKGA